MSDDTFCVNEDSDGAIPQLAGIQYEVGRIVSNSGAFAFVVDFVFELTLFPNKADFVAFFEFREVVEGV